MATAVRKFTFDTEFGADGRVIRAAEPVNRKYPQAEVDALVAEAEARGEASAVARAQDAAAAAAQELAHVAGHILARLNGEALRLRQEAVQLGLAAARAATSAALAQFAEEQVMAFFEDVAGTLRNTASVEVRIAPSLVETLQSRLEAAGEAAGLGPGLRIVADEAIAAGACAVTWEKGGVATSPQDALEHAEAAAQRWLAAEEERADQMDLFASP